MKRLILPLLLFLLFSGCSKSSTDEPNNPNNPQEGAIPVTALTLSEYNVELLVGETLKLTATIQPENASNKSIIWDSSDSKIVRVSEGLLTAVSGGTAQITAKAGSKSAVCEVFVKAEGTLKVGIDQWGEGSTFNGNTE